MATRQNHSRASSYHRIVFYFQAASKEKVFLFRISISFYHLEQKFLERRGFSVRRVLFFRSGAPQGSPNATTQMEKYESVSNKKHKNHKEEWMKVFLDDADYSNQETWSWREFGLCKTYTNCSKICRWESENPARKNVGLGIWICGLAPLLVRWLFLPSSRNGVCDKSPALGWRWFVLFTSGAVRDQCSVTSKPVPWAMEFHFLAVRRPCFSCGRSEQWLLIAADNDDWWVVI